jgi:hypothetical protein
MIENNNFPVFISPENEIIPICHPFRVFELIQTTLYRNLGTLLESIPENQGVKGKLFIFTFKDYIDLTKKNRDVPKNKEALDIFFEYYTKTSLPNNLSERIPSSVLSMALEGINNNLNLLIVQIQSPVPFCRLALFDLNGHIYHGIKDVHNQLIDYSGLKSDESTPNNFEYDILEEEEISDE